MKINSDCNCKTKCTTIDTQLNCRATAELSKDIVIDLSAPDKSLGQLLEKDEDESKNNDESRD